MARVETEHGEEFDVYEGDPDDVARERDGVQDDEDDDDGA